jgi:hypothetical protein
MNNLSRYDIFLRCGGLLSYGYLIYTYFRLWAFPDLGDAELILTYSVLMGVEFIMVHSGVFMIILSGNKYGFIFLILFYGLFAWSFNAIIPGNKILFAYMFVVLNRMKFVLYPTSKELKTQLIVYSAFVAFLYFILLIAFSVEDSHIPVLGLTKEYISRSGYHLLTDGGGLLIDKPQVGLAFGFTYFIILGLIEFFSIFAKNRLKLIEALIP